MTRSKYLCFLSVLFLLGIACNKKTSNVNNNTPNENHLENTSTTSLVGTWTVLSFPLPEESKTATKPYQLVFNADQSMGLKLDINNCGTNYQTKDGYLVFEEGMSCTEACCDSKEAMILSNLFKGSLKYTIQNSTMTISTEQGPIKLVNNKNRLQGSSWVAVSYADLKEKQATKFSKKYVLSFDDSRIQLRLDANNCNTSIAYADQISMIELPMNSMGCTRKCCDSKDGLLLMNMLQGKISYSKEAKQLILKTASKEIIFTPYQEETSNKD
ncbi:META domain-containing protein [Aureispira anguillae]|uniref:META domain-containing protein n=1 Tax=Aureispira anguillae TaxID=2864201 RepID=A0A916DSW4_9BACT|nr:META domain-containing protein [Aureispira anguillae]BDS11410.1 META domain-containing protein [Aureispira anguillae]